MNMKKFLTLLLMLLLGMSTSLLAYENTYAVIVGVADYKNFEKGNGDLKYTINDARLFKEFLLSKKGGSVPEENVILLLDEQASRANIIKTASELFAKAERRDRVIFYFSGHGGPGRFLPYDVTLNGRSMLTYEDVKSFFRHAKCDMKLLFADACHSGNMEDQMLKNQANNESSKPGGGKKPDAASPQNMNIVVMMSCKGDEVSVEMPSLQQGLFTYHLIKGLGGEANSDGNSYLTIQELFYYMYHKVQDDAAQLGRSQTPVIFGKFNLGLIVAEL